MKSQQRLLLRLLLMVVALLDIHDVVVYADERQSDEQSVNIQQCFMALREADVNKDGQIDETEHVLFLQYYGGPSSDYWMQLEQRPLELRAKFHAVACMCLSRRNARRDCCLGDKASIDISSITQQQDDNDSTTITRDDQEYLETVCMLTQRAMDQVERERIERDEQDQDEEDGPSSTTTSVWLRTKFEITLVESSSSSNDDNDVATNEQVLDDITRAMDMLVEQVLKEETTTQRRRRQRERLLLRHNQQQRQQRRQRELQQEIQYLPTQVESTPIDCNATTSNDIPSSQTVCALVSTTTYVVGPQQQLSNPSQIENSLNTAIASGRLQTLVDDVNPDSMVRIMDDVAVADDNIFSRPPSQSPPNGENEPTVTSTTNNNNDVWTYPGVIVGLVLAAVVTSLVLATAGLMYGKRRRDAKRQQLQAMQQGSLINMELRSDPSFDNKQLEDLEEGHSSNDDDDDNDDKLLYGRRDDDDSRGSGDEYGGAVVRQQALVSSAPDDDDNHDTIAEPPPSSTEREIVVSPVVGNRPPSAKNPSVGDFGASDNHMDGSSSYSTYSSSAAAVAILSSSKDRTASSGSFGVSVTPGTPSAAADVKANARNGQESIGSFGVDMTTPVVATTAAAAAATVGLEHVANTNDEDDDSYYSNSSSTSTGSSSSSDSDSSDDDDDDDISSLAASYDEHGIMTERAFEAKLEQHRESMAQARNGILEGSAVERSSPAESGSSDARVIAGATLGALAAGGAVAYAATREDEDKTPPEAQLVDDGIQDSVLPPSSSLLPDDSDQIDGSTDVKAAGGSSALDATPPPSQATSQDAEHSAPLTPGEVPKEPNVGVIAGAAALGGAVLYAATRNSGDDNKSEETEFEPSNHGKDSTLQSEVQSMSHVTETANSLDQDASVNACAGQVVGVTGAAALGNAAVSASTVDSEDRDNTDTPRRASRVGIEPPPKLQLEAEVEGDGSTTLVDIAVAGAVSFASIHDPIAVGEESRLMENEESVLGASSSSNLGTPSGSENYGEGSATLSGFAVAGAASLASVHDPAAVGEESQHQMEDSSDESTAGTSNSPGDYTSVDGVVDDPVAVGEESRVTDDPIPVGEDSVMVEHGSSASAYSSEYVYETESSPMGTLQRSEESKRSHGGEAGESTTLESRSNYTPDESHTQMVDVTMLRPPERPPSPRDTGAAVATLGIVGVGATAAYLAARNHDDESGLDSASESSSDGTSRSDHAATTARGEEVSSKESKLAKAPTANERLRPPESGSNDPYYATAAAMTVGATVLGTEAIYETSQETVGSQISSSAESSSSESSSASDSSSYSTSSSDTEETTENESSDDESMADAGRMGNDKVEAVSAVETQADGRTDDSIALISTDGYVSIQASMLGSMDESDDSSSGSSSEDVSTSATVGQITDVPLSHVAMTSDVSSRSTTVAARSISSRSDAAVVQGSVLGGNDTDITVAPTVDQSASSSDSPILTATARQNLATEPSASADVKSGGSGAEANGGQSNPAVVAGAVSGGAILAGAMAYAIGKETSADEDSESSSSDEHTTDDESSEEDEDDTDMAIAGPRSTSRSTLATTYTGTQSTSRSTLETSDAVQGTYQGHDSSSNTFSGRGSHTSLLKSAMDSEGAVVSAAAIAVKTEDRGSSFSEENSSSSYDSDSSDGYYSSSDASSVSGPREDVRTVKEPASASVLSMQVVDRNAATDVAAASSVNDDRSRNAEYSEKGEEHAASLATARTMKVGGSSSYESSGDAIVTESATLTESGDTFLAMEEAAVGVDLGDVTVTKTRFAPDVHGAEVEAVNEKPSSVGVAVATVGTGLIESEAAASATDDGDDSSESDSSDSDTSDDSSAFSESSSASDTSVESSGHSSAESDSHMPSNDNRNVSKLADHMVSPVNSSLPEQGAPLVVTDDAGLSGSPDVRSQLKPVRSDGTISRKQQLENSVPDACPGTRAQLLRARSDAMLPTAKRDESLQALLTSWDREYDVTTGTEETTVSSGESLVVQYADTGLPPIEESGQSDGSSQSLTSAQPLDASLSGNAIAGAMQNGSSSLLDFDYSLCTVAEEQSGDISHEGQPSATSAEHAAAIDAMFEKEVLVGLDPIAEHSAVADRVASNRTLPMAVSSTSEANRRSQTSQVVETVEIVDSSGKLNLDYENSGSYSRSGAISEQGDSKDLGSSDESSDDDSSSFSSEYTTDSTDSSEDSDSSSSSSSSDSDTDDSSSTASTPSPSLPDFHKSHSSSVEDDVALESAAATHQTESLATATSSRTNSKEEHDAAAESKDWAAIAAANKPSVPDKGAADAAEWAIKRSLSALKNAEEQQASSLTSSSASSSSSSSSSSDDLYSSDLFSSDQNSQGSNEESV